MFNFFKLHKKYDNNLFKIISNPNIQENTFKNNIEIIEIETHSYCNRKCWFCPNSIVDRHSNNIEMDEKLYVNLFESLKNIGYSKLINFHRFNEPLAKKDLILNRISQANKLLPKAYLAIFTNGDYLSNDYLDKLSEVGIKQITTSYYFSKDELFDVDNLKLKMENFIKKFNFEIMNCNIDNSNIIYTLNYNDMKVFYKASDFKKIGNSRGDSIKDVNIIYNKKFRCLMPLTAIYIDYNGNIMPCCNLRSDISSHRKLILGDLNYNNIFEIFCSENASKIRKYLYKYSIKESPCNGCTSYL